MSSRAEVAAIRIVNTTKAGKDSGFGSFGDKLSKLPPTGFVAVDAEFSGLGRDANLLSEDLGARYAAIRRLADTRAIFSVGLSLFSPVSPDEDAEESKRWYEVATYDWLMSCQDDFTVNANAGEFLVSHNFDFNRMFKKGIPYTRASTEKPPDLKGADVEKASSPWRWDKLPRGLLWRIGRQGVPLILHNGLFDLAFMYAAFQGPLPPTLHGFIGALLDCVPAGYWDNKMLASVAAEPRSYLSYLFASAVLKDKIGVTNAHGLPSDDLADPSDEIPPDFAKDTLCELYAFRGFCARGVSCPFKHDAFAAVEREKKHELPKDSKEAFKRYKVQSKKLKSYRKTAQSELSGLSKKRKLALLAKEAGQGRKSAEGHREENSFAELGVFGESDTERGGIEVKPHLISNEKKMHTAGWDAFCTGYLFAVYRERLPSATMRETRNRIAVARKTKGLYLCKSSFGNLDILEDGKAEETSTDSDGKESE
ncbi:unnamed protein product [Chondrus crispus]|uniref:C3H1-type domain-containing protein n=1 Tax=Chondrus crispus TaxID=2769 RepID=R7Q924_CHOCR|nr:unnamed protein product [Chondrus crispus]CDF35002.1 unnamed protein product [Chondrus crispus]|eukprot:XP_005714821.1 unnamed protein product [Chondrus crispus]